ncbi:MAG: energy transducer TonB [Chitinophagaceae bacterium]
MDINKILTADILDIIFEGRNKEYGAYDLRKTYNKRITKAMLIMLAVCLLIFLSSFIMGLNSGKVVVDNTAPEIELDKFKEDKKEPPPPPPPPKVVEPPKIEVAKFTPPKIVKDEEVKKEDEVKEIKEIENKTTGSFDQKGLETEVVQPVVAPSTGAEPVKQEEDYDKLFTAVQIESEFPGGAAAWQNYLKRNLNSEVVNDNGAPAGRYVVEVSFTVDKDGNISDVQGQMANGSESYGTIDEAVRIIKKGPKWKPGIQNGIQVKSRKKQRIVFEKVED